MTVPTTKVPVLTYTLFQTTDYFETMRMVTGGIVLPLTSVFGMITNVFNMAVYISEGLMVNINNMSLFSLAIADFMLCALSSFTYRFQRSAMLTMARSYLLMLQGSWFWAVGIILYGPNKSTWDLNSHMDVMQATIYFSWHCAAHFIILFALAAVMTRCHRIQNGPFRNGLELPMTRMDNGNGDKQDGYRLLDVHDDEDSDIEFEKPVDKALLPS